MLCDPSAEFYGEFSGEVRFSIRLLVFEKMAKNMIVSCDLQIKALLALRRVVSEINAKNGKIFDFRIWPQCYAILARNFMANSVVKSVFRSDF